MPDKEETMSPLRIVKSLFLRRGEKIPYPKWILGALGFGLLIVGLATVAPLVVETRNFTGLILLEFLRAGLYGAGSLLIVIAVAYMRGFRAGWHKARS